MAKFDFLNQNYTLEEIIDGLTDGNIENFKNDEDFLNFLIYYSLGNMLEGDIDKELKEKYADFEGLLNIALLDEYDIRGKKLYQIYEICGKDKIKFIRTLFHIGRYFAPNINKFSKDEVLTNLELVQPVDFIDESIMFPDGTDPKKVIEKGRISIYDKDYEMVKAYSQNLRYSLIKRINARIKESNSKLDMLLEIKTYEQEQKELNDEINSKKVPNEYAIDVNNLFFGKYTSNLGGGIINLNFNLVSWFENMNMRIGNYFVFRSVPSGDYCLIDESGKIYIPDKQIETNGISILPTSPIKYVDIASVKHILEESLKKLDPIEDEEILLGVKGLLELIDNNVTITVAELENYEPIIRQCFEMSFGKIFEQDSDVPKL